MMSCRDITAHAAADQLQSLTLPQRMQARAHLWMCVHCRRYVSQMADLGQALRRAYPEPSTPAVSPIEDAIVLACTDSPSKS